MFEKNVLKINFGQNCGFKNFFRIPHMTLSENAYVPSLRLAHTLEKMRDHMTKSALNSLLLSQILTRDPQGRRRRRGRYDLRQMPHKRVELGNILVLLRSES